MMGAISDSIAVAQRENGGKSALGALAAAATTCTSRVDARPDRLRWVYTMTAYVDTQTHPYTPIHTHVHAQR